MTSEELKTLDSALDQAELITRRLGGSKGLKSAIADEFVETTTPGMSQVQLAALDCGEVVTTNYDSLFKAEKDAAAHALSLAREIDPLAPAAPGERPPVRVSTTPHSLRDLGAPATSS